MSDKKARNHVDDLRGASRLAVDATDGVMALVEEMHRTIASGPAVLGRPLEGPARVLTGLVYGGIRGVTKLVGASIDVALASLTPLLGESAPGPEREAVLAALNGVLGDYLEETGNPLAIPMRFRQAGAPIELAPEALRAALPGAGSKVLVLVHGSSMNDEQWNRRGHDHGAVLAERLGYTPVRLHYNTGRHISTNGRAFADLLEQLVQAWPAPCDRIAIVGHSMGGLVARSACHYAEAAGHRWRAKLDALVCIGTPHHGAPLERGGNWVDFLLGISAYSAPFTRLGRIRSAGVTDLRYGSVLDEDWKARDRFARAGDSRTRVMLPERVRCYAIAGTRAAALAERMPGDGLVPVRSALGLHDKAGWGLDFPEAHRFVATATPHLDLLWSAQVCETMERWLRA